MDWTWKNVITTAVVSVSVAAVLIAFILAILAGNTRSDQKRLEKVRACVDAGGSWHKGDCLRWPSG